MKKFLAIVALLSVILTIGSVLLKAERPSYCVHVCLNDPACVARCEAEGW